MTSPANDHATVPEPSAVRLLHRCCYVLFAVEVLLAVAHWLWPEYRWGQGRRSYFSFDNSLTLASWLASMQLLCIGLLSAIGFHRDRQAGPVYRSNAWIWALGALLALTLSTAELTRFPDRLQLAGLPAPDVYEQFVMYGFWLGLLGLFAVFLIGRLEVQASHRRAAIAWSVAWGIHFLIFAFAGSGARVASAWDHEISLLMGVAYLLGCTLLLLAVGGYALRSPWPPEPSLQPVSAPPEPAQGGAYRLWLWIGVGGTTFTIIFLQILLFRMLTIFGDYLTANSVISIALLGIAVGGLIGAMTAERAPRTAILSASLLLPALLVLAFGATVSLITSPLLLSILLMLPFAAGSVVITVVLARNRSHFVYFVDLLGAACGALLVNRALIHFREEGALLVLAAFTCLVAICFTVYYAARGLRVALVLIAATAGVGLSAVGYANSQAEWLNIVKTKVTKRYPDAEILFSRSSLVGRYDVIRRKPDHRSLSTYDNGRIIDNMRRRPVDDYRIDPRIPHTFIEDPVILILGLSGDGISKTSRYLGKKVYGVEINPVVVELQTNELVKFNSNSYKDIHVAVMDGRSYINQSDEQYDIITLMNAHSARGRTAGRAPSPEYLHTLDAIESYLSHLTDRGALIVEEPVSRVRREVPVWKLVLTMRQALLDAGVKDPAQHFFIFQWRTRRNNYVQVLMTKQPLTGEDMGNLKQWLKDVDDIRDIERRNGRRMGPIRSTTTLLYSPDEPHETNYARILRGEADPEFIRVRNLYPTVDNRPFHFDVDPNHREVKRAYGRTLVIALILLPFLLTFLRHGHGTLSSALPFVFVVALTGAGYLVVEVVLLQRYSIFLGSPIISFSTIVGTLLFFSGLGSLWSGRVGRGSLYGALVAIVLLLALHQWVVPGLLSIGASLALALKVATVVCLVAPLAFVMGVPFPFVLRTGKERFTPSATALLFAINAAASALAVPLSFDISMSYGFHVTFLTGIVLYLMVALSLVAMHQEKLEIVANGAAAVVLVVVAFSPWIGGQSAEASVADRFRVFALSYGRSSFREDKIMLGGQRSSHVPFQWMFWVVKGNDRVILVDTGFDDKRLAKRWGLRNYVKPTKRLRQLGIHPDDVTDVILTHAHWDHMGGLAAYANAKVWIQDAEYQYAASRLSPDDPKAKGMRWEDFSELLAIEEQGRLRRVQGEHVLVPGVKMVLGGAHTPGMQYVKVNTLDGPTIIASDTTYLYDNNQRHKPIGTAVDHAANLATIRQMHREAASPFFIIPGHDPDVMRRFPQIRPGIVQITAVGEGG